MTYADVTATLRRELSDLLVEADVPYPYGQRALSGENSLLVQRYRASILNWLNRSTEAVVPGDVSRADWRWGPARLFADHLNRVAAVTLALTPPAGTLELGTPQPSHTVDTWRRAAVAATIALDRELRPLEGAADPPATRRLAALGAAQPTRAETLVLGADYGDRLRVIDDNAALTNALILLDVRVRGRPGWHRLGGVTTPSPRRGVSTEGLLNAVDLCRRWASAHDLPTVVDRRGHRATPTLVPGPIGPGVAGLHDAVHNTLLRLDARPRGDVMRLLIRSQAALTDGLLEAIGADDPSRAVLTARRAQYVRLANAARNLGGRVGGDLDVLVESEHSRGIVPTVQDSRPGEVARIAALLRLIDDKIATHVLRGAQERTYLVKDGRRLGTPGPGGVRRAADEWRPIDIATEPALLQIARALQVPGDVVVGLPTLVERSVVVGPTREAFDETLQAATPAVTASQGPLVGEPARSNLSVVDRRQLRAASSSTPAVQEALQDYLLRRPTRGAGFPRHKAHGKYPSPEATTTSAAPQRSGRSMEDRSVTPTSTTGTSLGPAR